MNVFTYILLALGIIVIGFFAYGRERVWVLVFGNADLGAIEFATFVPSSKPNHALFCPDDYCKNVAKYKTAPIFAMPVAELKLKLLNIIEAEAHIMKTANDDDKLEYRFVHYTNFMRYPDTIRIKLIELNDNLSTLAIFSESQIGHSDLGVNYKRIRKWLSLLDDQ